MPRYRHALPQLQTHRPFLTDGGLETTLIFHHGVGLPYFAAFTLLETAEGRQRLVDYYRDYLSMATLHGLGFILESPTWRASADWGARLGWTAHSLDAANRSSIELLARLRDEAETERRETWGRDGGPALAPIVLSGCLGPRGDGYRVDRRMSADEAAAYHRAQVSSFCASEADLVTAMTLTEVGEAIGIVRCAAEAGLPAVISFTVETDGRLPSGQPLGEAIEEVDAETDRGAAYFMVNCAHPSHFVDVLGGGSWLERIRGVRANASRCSHAELDEAETLDAGDPQAFGAEHRELMRRLPNLGVLGGCCGTDLRHLGALCASLIVADAA